MQIASLVLRAQLLPVAKPNQSRVRITSQVTVGIPSTSGKSRLLKKPTLNSSVAFVAQLKVKALHKVPRA